MILLAITWTFRDSVFDVAHSTLYGITSNHVNTPSMGVIVLYCTVQSVRFAHRFKDFFVVGCGEVAIIVRMCFETFFLAVRTLCVIGKIYFSSKDVPEVHMVNPFLCLPCTSE